VDVDAGHGVGAVVGLEQPETSDPRHRIKHVTAMTCAQGQIGRRKAARLQTQPGGHETASSLFPDTHSVEVDLITMLYVTNLKFDRFIETEVLDELVSVVEIIEQTFEAVLHAFSHALADAGELNVEVVVIRFFTVIHSTNVFNEPGPAVSQVKNSNEPIVTASTLCS